MTIFRNALIYFSMVFGAGFVLGTLRVLWLVPAIGERRAELLETPVMIAVVLFAARTLIRLRPATRREHLWSGLAACGTVLTADGIVAVLIRDMTLYQAFVERDPLTGAVYYASLGFFALAPWLLTGRGS